MGCITHKKNIIIKVFKYIYLLSDIYLEEKYIERYNNNLRPICKRRFRRFI